MYLMGVTTRTTPHQRTPLDIDTYIHTYIQTNAIRQCSGITCRCLALRHSATTCSISEYSLKFIAVYYTSIACLLLRLCPVLSVPKKIITCTYSCTCMYMYIHVHVCMYVYDMVCTSVCGGIELMVQRI